MPAISARFQKIRAEGEKALITFVTAGDQPLAELPGILGCLQEGGADLIEVGLPFSDPIADGPAIQASSQRALDKGVRLSGIFEAIALARLEIPIVLMGYSNTAMRRGLEQFARDARGAGGSGVILSDLTPEESEEWRTAANAVGLDTIFLVAPTSTDQRIATACEMSSGFVYCVSRTGVTGSASAVPEEVLGLVARVKSCTSLPACVGFGISSSQHVRMVCEAADGAVVGSFIVEWLHKNWESGSGSSQFVQVIRELKSGTLTKP